MSFRNWGLCLVLAAASSISVLAQSSQTPAQGGEDKNAKKSSTGKQSKPPAQKATTPKTIAAKPPSAQSALIDEKVFGAMRYRQVGPFRGGRVLAVTGVPG